MVRAPFADERPDLQDVLDALDDEDCRAIVSALGEPMTAQGIAEASDVPLSTTDRKLELLTGASLLEKGVEVRARGHHRSRYALDPTARHAPALKWTDQLVRETNAVGT